MNETLVSIITPTYNCAKFIGRTIESVQAQTYTNWEMVIVDDRSKDNTKEIVDGYMKDDPRIKYHLLDENSGAAVARTTSMKLAKGSYMAFLDSDDIWTSDKLEKQIEWMEQTGHAFTCTAYEQIDEEDNLWISTNDGLSRFDQEANKFINYTAMDGLQSNEFNGRSYFKSKDGEMFFGGINGVTAFYPKDVLKLSSNRNKSKVVIDKIKVNNKTYPYYGGNLSLKYNENNISIDFFLPDYLNTTKTTYEYKLEGVDEEWTFANKRNNANYATLDSGTYKVLIRARDNHGDLTPVTTLDLKIAPPPWRTPTAYLIYFSSAVIVIFLMWSYVTALEKTVKKRAEQLKKEAKEKEKLYIEKEKLYKEAADLKDEMIKRQKFKNDYFVNLSHELRTPLNVILATVQLIKLKNKEECLGKYQVEDYTNTLRNNADHLLKIINDIIDSSKIESGSYKLNIEKHDIVSLVEDTALSLKAYIEENNLDIIIDPEIEELDVECDKNEIERCVINLLSNAIKYTHGHGTIEVFIKECENETVEIAIKDTGVGISKEQQKIIFDRFVQADSISKKQYRSSGIGLTLVKSIIELHHGTIRVESELNKGSTFIITLPIRQENSK